MRLPLFLVGLLLVSSTLALLPDASARPDNPKFCVSGTLGTVNDCDYWWICVGSWEGGYNDACVVAVDYPCRYCKPLE